MRAIFFSLITVAALSSCSMKERRLTLLCTKVTLARYLDLQLAHQKSFGRFAASLEQLQQDPPLDCRENFYYDLKTAADGKTFELRVERRPEGKVWTVDQAGKLSEP